MKVYKVKVNGKVYEVELEAVEEKQGNVAPSKAAEPKKEETVASDGKNVITAPIAGKVLDIKVNVGDSVKKGQTVAIIEAMKLENEIQSAYDGKIAAIKVNVGDNVKNKDELIVLE